MSTDSNHESDQTGAPDSAAPWKSLQYWLNILVKLTVPVGAIAAAWLSVYFEERSSVRTLVNQREQAETSLKATMFGQLVGPIIGPLKDGQAPASPEQYALLVRLLALNFNDDFEFGPLMQSADDHLASSGGTREIEIARDQLRSVAHRVIDRQIARLWEDAPQKCASGSTGGPSEVTIYVLSKALPADELAGLEMVGVPKSSDSRVPYALPGQPIQPPGFVSPDCTDSLDVSFANPQWSNRTIDIQITRPSQYVDHPATGVRDPETYRFQLTSFTFPFSDNTPLSDGNRFALIENDVTSFTVGSESIHIMRVRLRWFPKYYYPPTERPANPREVQQKLGIGPLGRQSN
jgi:hypothetical protein